MKPLRVSKRLWITVSAGPFLFMFAAAGYFYISYTGFTYGLLNQMMTATMRENRNLVICLSYWIEFMQKLRLNETGIYGFDMREAENLDDFQKGKLAYHLAEFDNASELIKSDIEVRGETEDKLFWLAMSHLRQAEAQNCLPALLADATSTMHHPPDQSQALFCALPITQFHQHVDNAQAAANAFEKLLDRYDHTNRLYQWLLNFNYMTIGSFPGGVPKRYAIKSSFMDLFYGNKPAEVQAQFPELKFADRARELGVDTFNSGRGIAIEDFDKDGYLDIVTGGSFETVKYYKNDHGKAFIDLTKEVGLADVKQPFIITAADYDNDGWPDIFVARPFGNYKLFRNNRDGTFSDVTSYSGLVDNKPDDQISATWVAAWSDVDNDGDLDLFLAQWGFKIPFVKNLMAKPRADSKLFINEHGHFVDKTAEYSLLPVVKDEYFIGAAFGDYDNDGYPDLFLSSPLRNTSVLLKNIAGKRFERTNLIRRGEGGFTAAFLDFNHDGLLDLFWAGFADAKTSTEQAVFGEHLDEYHSGRTTIYLQTPNGKFEERRDLFDLPISTMGASFGDINNDGCADFYLGTGNPEGWFVLPNLMYVGVPEGQNCAVRLVNISMLDGFGNVQKGHGVVFFDFNNDGRQDIYSSLGGMWPADKWPNQFFVNKSTYQNSWIKIRLRGTRTNSFGVGARLKVVSEDQTGNEIVRPYYMDQGTGFGGNPYLAHIGLLNSVRVKYVEVSWPASRCVYQYQAMISRLNELTEERCLDNASASGAHGSGPR